MKFKEATVNELKNIKGVCLDIDDTLSTDGKLTATAYQSLWTLKEKGFFVVPITGRPAGWCDHFARFWPVDAVVGENGAFSFFMEDGKRKRLDTPGVKPNIKDLETLKHSILKKFPYVKWASDQPYREIDLAVDFCEDVKPWKEDDIIALIQLCKASGANVKRSSIHVNAWFGNHDKAAGFLHLIEKQNLPSNDEWLFIGDSPNDEPLFASFKNSVGVANLNQYLDSLSSKPRWLTEARSGDGFSEMVGHLCQVLKA